MTVMQGAEQELPAAEVAPGIAGRSPAQMAWTRLRKDRVAIMSMTVIVIVVLVALFAPLITKALGLTDDFNGSLIKDGGLPGGPLHSGISWDHPLGIEPLTGRDLMYRLLYGSRISLLVAGLGTLFTVVIGVILGMIAGYSGGWVDSALSRLMDLLLSFPQLILLIALSPILVQVLDDKLGIDGNPARITFLIIVFAVFGWTYLARLIRGQVLSIREREFVEAAISIGASSGRILRKEVLPNLWVPILVYASLLFPSYIGLEAALSFLGVGVSEPTPTWGRMLADSVSFYTVDPLYLFIPGTYLFIVVLTFNLLGDSIRDALDPRASRS
ncbi:MAG TPA: ABC transporter permease [Actinomycetales bacterium]|nr:ABC transporter permease [Actinomycetales bacterium]